MISHPPGAAVPGSSTTIGEPARADNDHMAAAKASHA
jgi:hypothetical protein